MVKPKSKYGKSSNRDVVVSPGFVNVNMFDPLRNLSDCSDRVKNRNVKLGKCKVALKKML